MSSSPRRRRSRDPGLCARGPCARCAFVCVPLNGEGERAARLPACDCWGITVPWLGAWPWWAVLPPCVLGQRPVVAHGCSRPWQAVRLRPELPRAGRLQTGPAPRRSRMNTASVMARDELLPRRSAGGCRTCMVAPCFGGHWSVVVPTVVSVSPMRSSGRCHPGSRAVQAEDAIGIVPSPDCFMITVEFVSTSARRRSLHFEFKTSNNRDLALTRIYAWLQLMLLINHARACKREGNSVPLVAQAAATRAHSMHWRGPGGNRSFFRRNGRGNEHTSSAADWH